jgi:hypothetical protein
MLDLGIEDEIYIPKISSIPGEILTNDLPDIELDLFDIDLMSPSDEENLIVL